MLSSEIVSGGSPATCRAGAKVPHGSPPSRRVDSYQLIGTGQGHQLALQVALRRGCLAQLVNGPANGRLAVLAFGLPLRPGDDRRCLDTTLACRCLAGRGET